jgi:low temperature requirement protein LtrA
MPLHVRMTARDPEEAHRPATPLELFLDLTFVVAIAQAASSLHHGLVDDHARDAIFGFPLVFFAIWWAWMNFTWFASAYDTDDAVYRVATLVQVAGVLILAAGIPRAFDGRDFGVMTLGYAVMRLSLVGQWLRAAASHSEGRTTALRYAVAIAALQAGWLARLALPDSVFVMGFLPLLVAELVIPMWAESAGRTSWHPGHIAERYGLFTIIVLGESVLAATVGVQVALDTDASFGELATVVVGGLVIVFSMWWLYFDMPAGQAIQRARRAFTERVTVPFAWGYGHYFVFIGAAAAGAGLAVAVDHATGHSGLSDVQAGLTITVPVALYVLAVWSLHYRLKQPGPLRTYTVPTAAVLIVASSLTPEPVLATGAVLAALVALGAVLTHLHQPLQRVPVGDG